MEFGSQAAQHDAAFSNISATPEACEQRQALFLRFLNEFQGQVENADPVSSQASGTPAGSQIGGLIYVDQLTTMKEREIETLYVNYGHLVEFNAVCDILTWISMCLFLIYIYLFFIMCRI